MTKSHYEKKEPFTSKFTGNFIVTVNLTFLKSLTLFYQPLKDPTVNQNLQEDVFNLGLNAFFNLLISM